MDSGLISPVPLISLFLEMEEKRKSTPMTLLRI